MKYLILVDAQNDFITGSLGTEEAKAAVLVSEFEAPPDKKFKI